MREFKNRYRHPLVSVVGDPALDMEEVDRQRYIKGLIEDEYRALELEREEFATEVMQYSDVEDVIARFERKGETITREEAAAILQREIAEDSEVTSQQTQGRSFQQLRNKCELILLRAKAASAEVIMHIDEIIEELVYGTDERASELIEQVGIKRKQKDVFSSLKQLIADHREMARDGIDQVKREREAVKHDPLTNKLDRVVIAMLARSKPRSEEQQRSDTDEGHYIEEV